MLILPHVIDRIQQKFWAWNFITEILLQINSISLLHIKQFKLSVSSVTLDNFFQGICPFHISCQVSWHKFVHNVSLLFIYFWLRSLFVVAHSLSLVAVSGGHSSLQCMGFSLQWPLVSEHGLQACGLQQLWLVGSAVVARGLQSAGSVVVAHGLSCSAACGIFPGQGLNPCPLRWQVDS